MMCKSISSLNATCASSCTGLFPRQTSILDVRPRDAAVQCHRRPTFILEPLERARAGIAIGCHHPGIRHAIADLARRVGHRGTLGTARGDASAGRASLAARKDSTEGHEPTTRMPDSGVSSSACRVVAFRCRSSKERRADQAHMQSRPLGWRRRPAWSAVTARQFLVVKVDDPANGGAAVQQGLDGEQALHLGLAVEARLAVAMRWRETIAALPSAQPLHRDAGAAGDDADLEQVAVGGGLCGNCHGQYPVRQGQPTVQT